EFEDQATARNKEIARTVEDQVAGVADPGGEGALLSIRCEFEDRIAARVRHKEIARTVKDQVAGVDPGGEGALLSIGCEFEDRVTIRRKEMPAPSTAILSGLTPEANVLFFPSGVNLRIEPVTCSATKRLPERSGARPVNTSATR